MQIKELPQPILILNLQINEADTKSIKIYSVGDATTKIQSFCTVHNIKDRNVIERLRNRAAACLSNTEKSNENDTQENIFNANEHKSLKTVDKVSKHHRVRSKQLFIDTSPNTLGVQSLAYTSKTSKAMGQSHASVQGQGHKLVKSLAEAVKAKLFTTKASKHDEMYKQDIQKENTPVEEKPTRKIVPQTSLTISEGVQKEFDLKTQPTMASSKNMLQSYEFKAVPRNTQARSFMNSLTEEKDLNTGYDSQQRNHFGKVIKKSSFYEYSNIADRKIDSNIYQQFSRPREIEKMDTKSMDSIEETVLKRMTMSELKTIFNKLDGEGSGHIGPRKMDLRSLSASEMQNAEPIIAEIFNRDGDAYFNFKDFRKIANEFVILD